MMNDGTTMMQQVQTIEVKGERFCLVPEAEFQRLLMEAGESPVIPEPDAAGNRPALATARALLAREIIRDRKAAGLTQQALAKLAGIRQETLSRIESGQVTASPRTVDRIDNALKRLTSRGHTLRRKRSVHGAMRCL